MKSSEIGFTFTADKSDRTQNLGIVLFRGETAVRILDILGGNNYVFSHFDKFFIIAARWTRYQLHRWMIFQGHKIPVNADFDLNIVIKKDK